MSRSTNTYTCTRSTSNRWDNNETCNDNTSPSRKPLSNENSLIPTSAWDLLSRKRNQKQLNLLQRPLPNCTNSNTINNPYLSQKRNDSKNGNDDRIMLIPLTSGITEISGEAGTGKTQICLSLCVSCVSNPTSKTDTQPPVASKTPIRNPYTKKYITSPPQVECNKESNDNPTALYISLGTDTTKSSSYTKRLQQITNTLKLDTQKILSLIYLKSIRNEEEFDTFIKDDLESYYDIKNLQLIVFDSIATLFRISDSSTSTSIDYKKRSNVLFYISSRLKYWSEKYNLYIVVINQASMVTPALGLSWSNCVNTRFYLTRVEENSMMNDSNATASSIKFTRYIHVFLSSILPPMKIRFVIKDSGCHLWTAS